MKRLMLGLAAAGFLAASMSVNSLGTLANQCMQPAFAGYAKIAYASGC